VKTPAEQADLDCVAAVSVNNLYDLYLSRGSHAWVRRLQPFAHLGHSVYLYDLRKTAAARWCRDYCTTV